MLPAVATITPSITMSAVTGVPANAWLVTKIFRPACTCVTAPSMSIRTLSIPVNEPTGNEASVVANTSDPVILTSRLAVSRAFCAEPASSSQKPPIPSPSLSAVRIRSLAAPFTVIVERMMMSRSAVYVRGVFVV